MSPLPPRIRGVRAAVGALVASGLIIAGAGAAQAHDELVSTSPSASSTVTSVPAAVVLTFGEKAVALGAAVTVVGPGGDIANSRPRISGTTVRQPLDAGAPAGAYKVSWRVTSADGHPVSGRFSFTAKAGSASPSPRASSSALGTSASSPLPSTRPDAPTKGRSGGRSALVAGALGALVGLGIVLAQRRRRSA